MDTVTITRTKLLEQLKKNREDHKLLYEAASEGWKQEVRAALFDAFEDAKDDKEYITWFDLPQPSSHVKDYDEVIERVEWHENEKINLSLVEFNHFVRDCWDWMPSFLDNAHTYSSSTSSSSSSSSGESAVSNMLQTKMSKFS